MKRWAKVIISVLMLLVLCNITQVAVAKISPEELAKIQQAAPAAAPVAPKQPRKILVFTLCRGYKHSSIPYCTKALEIMGEKTGAYQIVQSDDMAMFKPENLAQFDAVFFNNTTKLEFDPKLRKGLMDFVKSGKGIIGIHAATDNFYKWSEAAEMMGGLFNGHPWKARGTWAVKVDDKEHPVTEMFAGKGFKINDEIYRTKPVNLRKNCRVLLSLDLSDKATRTARGVKSTDNDLPVSWVRSFGKGRVFYSGLGHNHHIFWNPTILQHYLAGIQFATGDLPADVTPVAFDSAAHSDMQLQLFQELLAKITNYKYGQSREPLSELTDLIRYASDSGELLKRYEIHLAGFLLSNATIDAKQYVCRELGIIGTEKSIPILAVMAADPDTSDMARYALERIPGTAVDDALRMALAKATGKTKTGIINTLGMRRDAKSVSALSKLVYDSETTVAVAAVAALGRIADEEATEVLATAKDKTAGQLRTLVLDSYLKCADQLLNDGKKEPALAIYKQLSAADEPQPIRVAALRGQIASSDKKAGKIIIKAIKSDDPAIQVAAIRMTREVKGGKMTKALARLLPKLSAARQTQLLAALADRGDDRALSAVLKATKNPEPEVRVAAFSAIGVLGNISNLDLLVQTAATAKGLEQQAARNSLYRLQGTRVDKKILAHITEAEPKVKVELVRSIEQRNIKTATKTLFKTAQDTDSRVRIESFKALSFIAGPTHLPRLLELLIETKNAAERTEAEKAFAAVANTTPDKKVATQPIVAVLEHGAASEIKVSLLRILGKIGDQDTLDILRNALADKDEKIKKAAIRALSDWPNTKPIPDLLKVEQTSDNQVHKVLALRGFIRLIGLKSDRSAKGTVALYWQAMELASNVNEKRMVLSGLGKVRSVDSLRMSAKYLDDPALQQEAVAAVVKVAGETIKTDHEETQAALQKVLTVSKNQWFSDLAKRLLKTVE